MNTSGIGPRVTRARWPGPITDASWRGRLRINANRIGAEWGKFLGEYEWERFVTLTVDPRRMRAISETIVSREVFQWCNEVSRLSRCPVGWAYAVEGGGGGWLHAHALLIGIRDGSWDAAESVWRARNGHVVTRPVDDPIAIASYLCKAIGPNGEVVVSDTLRRYLRRGLKPM